jgi:hypothetical protein
VKVSYQPTYDQFADNYLSTYYSGGVRTLQRAAGGPLLIIVGALLAIWVSRNVDFWLLSWPLIIGCLYIALRGLSLTLRPLFNLLLVWLRRHEQFESPDATTTIELRGEALFVEQNKEKIKVPLEEILSVLHRSSNTWIVTKSDSLIYIPRADLISGDHDDFVEALEAKLAPEDPEEDEPMKAKPSKSKPAKAKPRKAKKKNARK